MNRRHGGANLEQSVFSPQLDLYAFQKGYRDTTTLLTYPISLHNYHRNGYPGMLAFRDGEQILQGFLDDYDSTFRERAHDWWPDETNPHARLVSGLQFVHNYEVEPADARLIAVFPESADSATKKRLTWFKKYPSLDKKCAAKFERELDSTDLLQNLAYGGDPRQLSLAALAGQDTPIRLSSTTFGIGPYTFSTDSFGIRGVMPNPYNPERYIDVSLHPSRATTPRSESETDFCVWRASPNRPAQIVLDGRFAKDSTGRWYFSDTLAVVYANLESNCKGGVCPLPVDLNRSLIHHTPTVATGPWMQSANGRIARLGTDNCRFPDVAVAPNGSVGVVWEERGDILFVRISPRGMPSTFAIEDGPADAYNPRVAFDGTSFLIAYVSNADGYYHLYGRYVDGDRLSDEVRLSPRGPFSDITPDLVSDGSGRVALAWSQWRANQRFPKYRMILDRASGPVRPISILYAKNDSYNNAWALNLALDSDGRPYGMWNQHYPSLICVCGGPLDGPPTTPQEMTGNVDTSEKGEYPSTAFDSQGRQWAVWETYAYETWLQGPQRILAARFNRATESWTAPVTVSDTAQNYLTQTPRLAALPDGSLVAVWSGRSRSEGAQWGIYLSRFQAGHWQEPRLISEPGVCSRAPEMAIGADGSVWVVWHAGIGEGMTVRVLEAGQ